jgi:hypothetical protein
VADAPPLTPELTEESVRQWCAERGLQVNSLKFWEVAAEAIRFREKWEPILRGRGELAPKGGRPMSPQYQDPAGPRKATQQPPVQDGGQDESALLRASIGRAVEAIRTADRCERFYRDDDDDRCAGSLGGCGDCLELVRQRALRLADWEKDLDEIFGVRALGPASPQP